MSSLIDQHLNVPALQRSGLIDVAVANSLVQRFKARRFHYRPLIWSLLMFQMWYARWVEGQST